MSPSTASGPAITGTVTGSGAVRGRYSAPTLATVTVALSNQGSRAADHAVLLFAAPPGAGKAGAPLKNLVGFERVRALAPGASTTVTIELTAWSVALADDDGVWGARVGGWSLTSSNGTTTDAKPQMALLTVSA